MTPVALACFELIRGWRIRERASRREAWSWAASLFAPVLPLLCWYGYHYFQTGFVFGNPEYLRYNATANLDAHRIVLCLWHRLLHMTAHMNLYVATLSTAAALLMPLRRDLGAEGRQALWQHALPRIVFVLVVNWLEFSVLGGALLTRYLLPMYPLFLLLCVRAWVERMQWWPAIGALAFAAFAAAIWINPPYAFAPEDNLTYRDMVVLHQAAISWIARQYPQATVLTAWPAAAELARPELGYTRRPIKTVSVENFSRGQMTKAAADPGAFDTALLFSTKWEPPPGRPNLGAGHENSDALYFDFHHDLSPTEAAALLHGEVVWERQRKGEWAAILRFPRVVNANVR